MTDAAKEHFELEKQVLQGRFFSTLTEAEEDRLLERMGDLWWQMTKQEHTEANERAAAYSRGHTEHRENPPQL